jgi:glycosyltransferase involved in cell wall biosynthesis
MPCYNAGQTVADSVKSALQQTHQAIKLILVDDGSRGDSLAVLGQFDDLRLKIIVQTNQGVCAARNRGLALASAEEH